MTTLDSFALLPALVIALVCGGLGGVAPLFLARLPEPEPEPTEHMEAEQGADNPEERKLFSRSLPPAPTKVPYADLAAAPYVGVKLALWSGLSGGFLGGALGWSGALVYLAPLVPIGVVLFLIDVRTSLLPTRILHLTYGLMAVLIPVAALIDSSLTDLYRAGFGWLIIGGWFWILWMVMGAWGFGDVRLARVLGPALGYLGWYELVTGLVLIILVGGIGGAVVSIARRSMKGRVPYGPFLLIGALGAAGIGPWLAISLGY